MSERRLNLRTLDMLRGLLAVYVLLGHCRWLLWAGHAAWMTAPHQRWLEPVVYASASLRYGREAVMVFFVLSGFFIHLGAERQVSAGSFYRRRLHRLGATYLFALIVTIGLDSIGRSIFPALYYGGTGDSLTDAIFLRTGYGAASVGPAVVGLPSSLGYDFGSNGPLWSLAFEMVYYALYPLWLALRRFSAYLAFGIVPAICLLMSWLPSWPFPILVLILYPVWLAGAGLAEMLPRTSTTRARAGAAFAFVGGCALHAVGAGALSTTIAPVLYGGAAVVMCATLTADSVQLWPVRLFEYLGIRSYSIYVVHFPLVALMGAAEFATPGGRPFHGWHAIAGALAAIGFGCLCFEICERHFVHHRVQEARLAA
jgi:peptidoglycan/LPS O-acetylase OafA/YrhL